MKKSLFWLLAAALQFYKVISYFKLIKYYKKIFEKLKDLSILSVSELSS